MISSQSKYSAVALAVASLLGGSSAFTSSAQAANALGLSTVAPVQYAGSDAASSGFQSSVLPSIRELLNHNLSEATALKNVNGLALDPSKLYLSTAATARVYFLGEGAGYHNAVGFNTISAGQTASAPVDSTAKLIFTDASSSVSPISSNSGHRSASEPLLAGDFVDLGNFSAGSQLDFFLVADGAHGGQTTYTANPNRNPDRLNHVVSFALKDSPYLILAFEDLFNGGDKDYNDVIMAVDIGHQNVQRLIAAPEPTLGLTLASFIGLGAVVRRRRTAATA